MAAPLSSASPSRRLSPIAWAPFMAAVAVAALLGASPDHPVSRQVIARSHPDLFVLERLGEEGRVRKVIPVEEVRGLPEFFS